MCICAAAMMSSFVEAKAAASGKEEVKMRGNLILIWPRLFDTQQMASKFNIHSSRENKTLVIKWRMK